MNQTKNEVVATGRGADGNVPGEREGEREREEWYRKEVIREGAKSLSSNEGLSFYMSRTLTPL